MEMHQYQEAYDNLSFTVEQKTRIAAKAAQEAYTVSRKDSKKHHMISKIAAAVCLVSLLTVTAEAAGITTPVSEILAPIFGGAVAQTEVIDRIGRPIDAGDTDNGVTVRAEAIIGDQYNACIVFSITRDDGTPLLPEGITAQQLLMGSFGNVSLVRSGGTHGSAHFQDDVPGDSEIQFIYNVSYDEPLNKSTATVDFRDLSYWDGAAGTSVPVVVGHWKFRFDVDYEDSSVSLGGGETFCQDGMEFTITDLCISPVGIRVDYEVDSEVQWSNAPSGKLPEEDRLQMERYMENVEILLVKKDGSVIDMSNTGGSIQPDNGITYCTKSTVFSDILLLEELESVRVGGIDFPLDG